MAVIVHQVSFLFFILILLVIAANSASIKLKLIHRREIRAPISDLRRTIHLDALRLRSISEKSRRKSIYADRQHYRRESGEMTIYSAADFGVGQYIVDLRAGSPPQRVAVIADTGSDLTWIKCSRYSDSSARNVTGRRFLADRSVSFKTVACSSTRCRVDLSGLFSLSRCPSPLDPCSYDYRYADGSTTQGIFANETAVLRLTNGRRARLHNVLIGCSGNFSGQSFQAADGVLGLGYSNFSFVASAAARFGGKFSYCLVDHLSPRNRTSYITFGPRNPKLTADHEIGYSYTDLILGVVSTFYAVNVRGISIGDSWLEIPSETWNLTGSGGVILDTGSSLTALSQPAYRPVIEALRRSLAMYRNLDLDLDPLRYCFNSTGLDEAVVPRLAIHFGGGARFEPPVKSYVIDAAPGVKCLGFVESAWPAVSVIGNIMQQNHVWEFDLVNRRLGFAASTCT